VELGTKAASTVHVEAGRSLSDTEVIEALADEGDYTLVR